MRFGWASINMRQTECSVSASNPALIWVRPSRVARRLLLHLFVIGPGHFREPRRFGPFEKPGAGLFWVESGHGQLRLDDAVWELRPGPHFWFYGTQQTRLFLPAAGQTMVTQSFWFGGPGLEGWLEELDVNRQPQFRLRHPSRIYRVYRRLLRLVRARPANWEWEVHLGVSSVLQEFLLARNLLVRDEKLLPKEIGQVLDAVEADAARDWKASELAALAGMSYSAFRSLFRETMQESPHQYLQRTRMDLARQLLTNPKLRIKEIAQMMHFSSEYYFSNFFRKRAGVSPTEFRQHLGLDDGSSRR